MKPPKAFTLIELLTVLAIVGVLMALLFPAVTSVLDQAKKAQAITFMTGIKTAIVSFDTEYSRMPDIKASPSHTGQDVEVGGTDEAGLGTLLDILRCPNSAEAGYGGRGNQATVDRENPRAVKFLEGSVRPGTTKKPPKNAIWSSNGAYYDAWENAIFIAYDFNYDNTIGDPTGGVSLPYEDLPTVVDTKVLGWTYGKDKKIGNNGNKKRGGSDDSSTW